VDDTVGWKALPHRVDHKLSEHLGLLHDILVLGSHVREALNARAVGLNSPGEGVLAISLSLEL
jgi:hypothetical protein